MPKKTKAAKTKIALFDLTGCEGCEFHILSLNELLLDLFQDFEIANWRLLKEPELADFDIAFIEGAATTKEDIKLLKQIRETSKIVVAIGACAISGNIFAQISPEQRKKLATKIYDKNYKIKAEFLEPVEKFIKVDKNIPGCPPDMIAFKKLLTELRKEKITSKVKDVPLPDFTAKIEGHGVLRINFKKQEVEFEVTESERLVEALVLNKNIVQAPFASARICGICPIAHNLCSWSAIENALKINLSAETIMLRKILLASQIIKSHLLHLFFLVLPDYAGLRSSIALAKKYPAEFHLMLSIKRAADTGLNVIGGSTAFPLNTILAGFRNPVPADNLFALRDTVYDALDEAEDLVNLFASLKFPKLQVKTKLATSSPSDSAYPFYPGIFPEPIKEIIKNNSTAKLGVLENGEIIKTGALARLKHFPHLLNKQSKTLFDKLKIDTTNPFNNNLAQAIETLHFLEEIILLIEDVAARDLKKAKGITEPNFSEKPVSGAACLEAPRGILCHQVKISPQGKIINYNIIPPTQINLASLEKEAQELIKSQKKGLTNQQSEQQVEQLIRAFDPCITCAVH